MQDRYPVPHTIACSFPLLYLQELFYIRRHCLPSDIIVPKKRYKVNRKKYRNGYKINKNVDVVNKKQYNEDNKNNKGGDVMSIKTKTDIILKYAGITGRGLAAAFNCPAQTIANKVARGLVRIDDLIRLCHACKASLTITTKDGVQIPLTVADIEEQTKTKE